MGSVYVLEHMENKFLYQDPLFRKVVVGSTGLAFVFMLGSVAAYQNNDGGGAHFQLGWAILFPVALALWLNARVWNLVFEIQENDTRAGKPKLLVHLGLMTLVGIGCFLYPIRFVEQSHLSEILRGLLTAGSFLSVLFYLIYKSGKFFGEMDDIELERVGQKGREVAGGSGVTCDESQSRSGVQPLPLPCSVSSFESVDQKTA